MNKNPQVSILIPAYNSQLTLRECLASVLTQSEDYLEVIVVDNASTDQTSDIIKEFQKKDKRIRYIFEPHQSRGAARNAGINSALGDIIVMIDSDCVAPYDWLKRIIEPITNGDADAVMGGEMVGMAGIWSNQIQIQNEEFLSSLIEGEFINHLDTKNFAIKTKVMKQYLFDHSIHNMEDFELYLRLRNQVRIRYCPDIQVKHFHKTSLKEWAKLSFDRSYWTMKIYEKHKNNLVGTISMFESFKFMNHLKLPFWLVKQLFVRPFKQFQFIFISELFWRFGLIWGKVR